MKRRTTAVPPAPAPEGPAPLSWLYDMPLLTNPLLWYDLVKVLAIAIIAIELLGLTLTYFIDNDAFLIPLQVWLIPLGVLGVLFILVCLIMRNRIPCRFTLDARAARYEGYARMDGYERTVNRIFSVLALLTLGLRGLGARIFGAGGSDEILWRDVDHLHSHPRLRVITLANSWRAVLRLYCPAETYDEALAYCHARLKEAKARHARRNKRSRASRSGTLLKMPWWFYLLWALGVALAFVLCLAWPWLSYDGLERFALLAGFLVLVIGLGWTRWWSKLLAYLAVAASLLFLGQLLFAALAPFGGSLSPERPSYTLDTGLLALSFLGGLLLLGAPLWRIFQPVSDTGPAGARDSTAQESP